MGTVDIETAQATIKKNLESSSSFVLTQAELDKAYQLLRDYGSQREDLQKRMVALLTQYDPSGIDRDWLDQCSRGRDLLNTLNGNMPSANGGGLAGAGLDSFYRGETSIWNENARAEIALRAKEMKTIRLTNLKLIQDCNEELKKVVSDEKDVQKYVEGTFGGILDVLGKTASILWGVVKLDRYAGIPPFGDQLSTLGDVLKQSFAQAMDAANKKQALLKILLARLALLKDLKGKLNQDAIKAACETGSKTAENLYVAGRSSPYEARDWEEFGKECEEELEDERDRGIADAETLFNLLYNQLDEQTQESFEALSTDPSQWERWDEEIGKTFESIKDALDKMQAYTDTLAESKIKVGLKASVATGFAMLNTYTEDWKKTAAEIKDKLRRS